MHEKEDVLSKTWVMSSVRTGRLNYNDIYRDRHVININRKYLR